jgi:hypothetical protein
MFLILSNYVLDEKILPNLTTGDID